jgi:hypothetical protein
MLAPVLVEAACAAVGSESVLLFGNVAASREPSFGPPLYLRFAFAPALGHDYLIPENVIEDRGLEIPAPDAYDWIEGRGTLFPRADVVGLTPAGQPIQRFLKELDLAAPPLAFAARAPEEFPGAQIALAVLGPDAPPLPALLARAVPALTLAEAQTAAPLAEIVRRWRAERQGG